MLRSYDDIIAKLGAPQWWDDNGCPRYCTFEPRACGVYDQIVALIEIACQNCDERFLVSMAYDRMALWKLEEAKAKHGHATYPTAEDINAFHFGDPPPHGCVGDTMNCDTYRVLEFWEKGEDFEWERKPEYEISYASGQPWNQRHEEQSALNAGATTPEKGATESAQDSSSFSLLRGQESPE